MIEANSNLLQRGASGVLFADAATDGACTLEESVPVPGFSQHLTSRRRARGCRSNLAATALLLLAATAAPAVSQPPPAAPAKPSSAVLASTTKFDNGVIAVVDGDPITLRELKRYAITSAPFLPPDIRNDYKALLDSMIEHRLLRAEFEKNGIHAPDEMVERYISGVLEENRQTRAALEIDVAKTGLSWKDYFERMREEVERIQLVNLLIRSRVNVSEEEVRRAWETDPQYLESEKLVVAAIFIPVPMMGEAAAREQIAEVQKEAKSDFAAAARKYSKGPGASEGGMLGEFRRGTMAAHFEKALVGLDEGEMSGPVEGPGGFYIVELADIKSSGRRPFDEVKEELTEKIYEQRLSERYKKWVTEDLRKDHRIDNLVDSLAVIAANAGAKPAPLPPETLALPGAAPPARSTSPAAPGASGATPRAAGSPGAPQQAPGSPGAMQ